MLNFYFKRVVAHTLVLISIPLTWWFYPHALLQVVSFNTRMVERLILMGIDNIPDPTRHYVKLALKPGEWLSAGIHKALILVPVNYRDQVEVVIRLKYDPGAWLMLFEATFVVLLAWFLVSWYFDRRKLHRWRKLQSQKREPTF